jgi:HK97 family phage portal protein
VGIFAKAATKTAIGYPAPGWAPPYGYAGDSIATTVNSSTAMGVSAFTAGIRLIAEDLGSFPLITYKRLTKGRERAYDHPAYELLHDEANPEMTAMVFRETGIAHMYSWGNWYSEKELNGVGTTVRLWPLRPDKMEKPVIKDGKRFYRYTLPDGGRVVLPASRVFHVPGWGFDGIVGYSRITLMRRALESAIVSSEYGLRTLANDARPGVTIKHPQQLSVNAKKNIASSWDEAHSGLTNAQRTAVLDEGMEIETMGFSPEDAQYLDSRKFSNIEIAQGLRLPPHKLADLENAHFTNIEESNLEYVTALTPPATRIEQQIKKDIIGKGPFFSEHLFDSLLRGKTLDRYNAYRIATNGAAWMNSDDVRERENMTPLPDGKGQIYLAPLNSAPVELLAQALLDQGTSGQ